MESIPSKTLAWRLYGAGLENFGNQDAPDNIDIRPLKDDEILTKVEAKPSASASPISKSSALAATT